MSETLRAPRVLSLFAGIGGFDLGLERSGFQVVAQCEIDPFCQKVLRKHWPDVWLHDDVRTLTGDMVRQAVGEVDVICGGYPCQPFSQAGKRLGEEDERHLWPECLRLLCEIRPRIALFENVRGHLSLGLDAVLSDLARSGFDAEWRVLRAEDFGAPHGRPRLFIAAYPEFQRLDNHEDDGIFGAEARMSRQWWEATEAVGDDIPTYGGSRYPVPPDWGVGYGVSSGMDKFDVRNSVRALGNAIVPACAEWVGKRVMEAFF